MARFICFIVFISIIFQNVSAIHNARYGFAPELLHADSGKDANLRSPKFIEPEAFDLFRHNGRSKRDISEADATIPIPAKNDSSQSTPIVSPDKSSKTPSNLPAEASKNNNQTQLVHNNITTMVSRVQYDVTTYLQYSDTFYSLSSRV